jgi:energy-coupling factor transporter ATP-binding protein EcfA2
VTQPLISLKGLKASYDPQGPTVLDGIDLEIDEGEFVLFLGPTGSGKTTLGLCLNGIIPHVTGRLEGQVVIDGLSVPEASVSEASAKVGMLFQDVESMLAMLYVEDEVAFGPENLQHPVEEVIRRQSEALATVGMEEHRKKFVFELSGGQKQKVAIASILAMKAPVLFLDEPAANLDPRSSGEVMNLVAKLTEDHTVILFDNRVDQVAHLTTRLVVIDQGKIAADGSTREVLRGRGLELLEDLGIWIPQLSEIALRHRRMSGTDLDRVPMTVPEAIECLHPIEFVSEAAVVDLSGRVDQAEPALAVENLEHVYEDGTRALNDISFDVPAGHLTAIVGPNGSGKTTLSKHFVGLLRATSGTVRVNGLDVKDVPTSRLTKDVGFVFQYPDHQFVTDTVAEEVSFSLEALGVPEDEIQERVDHELDLFGLLAVKERHPYMLSGGEKRRLSVATMLIAQPSILILDEPTYAQDKSNTDRMLDALYRATGESAQRPTILFVTHDMRLVTQYAERVIAMADGRLLYEGPVGPLFEDGDMLIEANLDDPPLFGLCRRLRSLGHNVPLRISTPSEFVGTLRSPMALNGSEEAGLR